MEDEDWIIEASHIIVGVIEILVYLPVLALVLLILESGGSRTEDTEQYKGKYQQG